MARRVNSRSPSSLISRTGPGPRGCTGAAVRPMPHPRRTSRFHIRRTRLWPSRPPREGRALRSPHRACINSADGQTDSGRNRPLVLGACRGSRRCGRDVSACGKDRRSARESCTLFSFEPGQELAKGFCAGPFGAFYGRIAIASQSDRKRLAIAINLPSPAPRIWVRLLHHEMVSSGLHATIVRHGPVGCQERRSLRWSRPRVAQQAGRSSGVISGLGCA
jgi:hypothetical protein